MDADLGLSDEDYWRAPASKSAEIENRLHVKLGFRGICLGGPSRVSLEDHQTIPVLVYQNDTFFKMHSYGFDDRGVILAVDHRANLVYANEAVVREPEYEPLHLDPPEDDPDMVASVLYEVELRERLKLPWARAGYYVHAISRDQRSNPIHVQVGPSPSRYQDDEVERYLEEMRRRSGPRAVRPAVSERTVPHYGELESSLPIPEQRGIGFKLPRVLLIQDRPGARTPWLLEGSFRLPALPRDIVRPDPSLSAEQRALMRPELGWPTAVIGIALVLVGADSRGPWVLQLGLPSFDPIDPTQAEPMVTGRFLIDLRDLPECPLAAQTYFAYAFAFDVVAGPAPTALINEAMLPPDVAGPR